MAFSFLCHTAILPIYCELDRWARLSPRLTFNCSLAMHTPCCSYLSGRPKRGCRTSQTSASASASCFTWSPLCSATSPSMVGPAPVTADTGCSYVPQVIRASLLLSVCVSCSQLILSLSCCWVTARICLGMSWWWRFESPSWFQCC